MEKVIHRTAEIDYRKADNNAKTVEASISSEYPVERPWGKEILVHNPGAIVTTRAPFPILLNHKADETPIGIADTLRLEGTRLKARFRFGDSSRAQECWEDVKSGILRNVSISYRVLEHEDIGDECRVTKWEILEVSLVSIPADHTVGVGRSLTNNNSRRIVMEGDDNRRTDHLGAAEQERKRTGEILAMARTFNTIPDIMDIAEQAISQNWKEDRFRKFILGKMQDGYRSQHSIGDPPSDTLLMPTSRQVGIYGRELESFSLSRALNAAATNDWRDAGLEREVSIATAKLMGRKTSGLVVPFEVLGRSLSVGTAAAGGNLVGTDHRDSDFVEVLRNRARVIELGAMVLEGLQGNVEIPRQTGAGTAYWVAEDGTVSASDQAFDKVTLTPTLLGALTTMSRKLTQQSSPQVEDLIRSDLAKVLAIELDRAAINGSGSNNQPTGILNTDGVAILAGGTDGIAPTWPHIVNLVSEVAADSADFGKVAFLTNSKVRGALQKVEKSANTAQFVWETGKDGDGILSGHRALVSNNVPSNLTKGSGTDLSAIIFGAWQDLIIGFWGAGIELMVDPYGTNFNKGALSVRALVDCDIAVRHEQSFAAMVDIITT